MAHSAIPFKPVVVETVSDDSPSDRELAGRILKAASELQEAMDTGIKAGLVVKPSFKLTANRYRDLGIAADAFVCHVQIYRKLT